MSLNRENIITKKGIWVTSSVVFLIVIGMVFLFIIPQKNKIFESKKQLKLKKAEFDQLGKDASRSNYFSMMREELDARGHLFEKTIIGSDQVVEFISKIENFAGETGNEIVISHKEITAKSKKKKAPSNSSETVGDGAEKKELENNDKKEQVVQLLLTTEGKYKNFLKFLYKLENMEYVFDINSLKVSSCSSSSLNRDFYLKDSSNSNSNDKEKCHTKGEILLSIFID